MKGNILPGDEITELDIQYQNLRNLAKTLKKKNQRNKKHYFAKIRIHRKP